MLFDQFKIKNITLKNKITMAPTFMAYGNPDGTISPATLAHYQDMAAGGAAMVVVENMAVDHQRSRFGRVMRIDHDDMLPDLTRLAQTIKDEGAAAIVQISHSGRYAFIPNPMAPSPVPVGEGPTPEPMNKEQIDTVIQQYAQAAVRAQKAGFDGVEIHGATGYLPAQFLSPRTNLRTDEYGGSLAHRMRFGLELTRAVLESVGSDYPVGYRFMADEWLDNGLQLAESTVYARELSQLGVAYLSVMGGCYESMFTEDKIALSMQVNYMADLAQAVKKVVSVPVIAAGRIATPEAAQDILSAGQADLIGLGRVLLADPQWPAKARDGQENTINACRTNCDVCIKLVGQQRPVICAAWDQARKNKFKSLLNL